MKKAIVFLVTGVILAACAGPDIVKSDPNSVTIQYTLNNDIERNDAFNQAMDHCKQYGKVAIPTSNSVAGYVINQSFACQIASR
ncbi:MAG: hypothetical protein ACYC1L_18130 [Alphaproteobacteria bacterium]